MPTKIGNSIEILLIEDNPGDVRLTQVALQEAKVNNIMTVVGDGVAALAYLRKQGRYAQAKRPGLILLDLNLPLKSGFDVLNEIKTDEDLKLIPVVILTSSQAEQDIVRSYKLYGNAFITKPIDLDEFLAAVKSLEGFWLEIAKLPLIGE
jgi:CheY-like chemotaxis protein